MSITIICPHCHAKPREGYNWQGGPPLYFECGSTYKKALFRTEACLKREIERLNEWKTEALLYINELERIGDAAVERIGNLTQLYSGRDLVRQWKERRDKKP